MDAARCRTNVAAIEALTSRSILSCASRTNCFRCNAAATATSAVRRISMSIDVPASGNGARACLTKVRVAGCEPESMSRFRMLSDAQWSLIEPMPNGRPQEDGPPTSRLGLPDERSPRHAAPSATLLRFRHLLETIRQLREIPPPFVRSNISICVLHCTPLDKGVRLRTNPHEGGKRIGASPPSQQ